MGQLAGRRALRGYLSSPRSRSVRVGGTLVAVALTALSLGGLTNGVFADTTPNVPLPPSSVTVSQAGPGPDLSINWVPATSGSPASGATVQLYNMTAGSYQTQEKCAANCTSTVFRGLKFGTTYAVLVWPHGVAGYGQDAGSNSVKLVNNCPAGACVTLDATSALGPADRRASGILHSLYPVSNEPADMAQLNPTMWRSAPRYNSDGSLNWGSWDVAQSQGTPTTLVLSDMWWGHTNGGNQTPWANWTAYTSWVQSTVQKVVASGRTVNYWEVYNEPGSAGYYPGELFATETPALLLQQFLVTYQAIRSIIPNAAIIGPSLEHWSDTPNTMSSGFRGFDMVTFLNFAAANNLQLAAVTWHFINDNIGAYPSENTLSPQNVVDEVTEARSLIAGLPDLGNPKIFINEYSMPEVQSIPGWDVEYLSALTNAGVDLAGRSCWSNDCANPDLDGLLSTDGSSTMPDFWVHEAYDLMSGSMIRTTSSDDNVAALGSYDSSTGIISALVGRGEGCTENAWCLAVWPWMTPAASEPLTVQVKVPWTSGTVRIADSLIPSNIKSPVAQPAAQMSNASIVPSGNGGIVTITIPSFADGAAASITLTKSS